MNESFTSDYLFHYTSLENINSITVDKNINTYNFLTYGEGIFFHKIQPQNNQGLYFREKFKIWTGQSRHVKRVWGIVKDYDHWLFLFRPATHDCMFNAKQRELHPKVYLVDRNSCSK